MAFDPLTAVHRFGMGPSPLHALPRRATDLLEEAAAGDPFADTHPFTTTADIVSTEGTFRDARGIAAKNAGTVTGDAAKELSREMIRDMRDQSFGDFRALIVRHVGQPLGLGERLVTFWTDHFTVVGMGGIGQYGGAAYSADAIRPYIAGSFAEMAKAVIRAPLMLVYLDQILSTGPNSVTGKRRAGRGINENLARELLELHTLGVGGPYDQRDVRELAALLTGLSTQRGEGFRWRPGIVEPGPETVLGRVYAGDDLSAIDAAIEDLARHPSTARHLAHKLAVHFVSDAPPEALIRHMAARYVASDGDLGALSAAMLEHPAAWDPARVNVKWPVDYMSSALRALGLTPERMARTSLKDVRNLLLNPMGRMGQRWERAPDPAGWEEADFAWITPQAVAERVNWAMRAPVRLTQALPDPRDLLGLIAGDTAPGELSFAISAAQDRREGVGLVLASPSFQRR
ncbi:MAG: DUF1800 domain-containing protein [Pseudomonadota bacterium]